MFLKFWKRESGKTESVPTPADQQKKRKKCLIVLTSVLIPLLLAAVLLLGLPQRWQVPPMTRPEAVRLQLIIGKLTSAMLTKDGKMVEEAEVELTQAEINTLLANGLRAAQMRQSPELYYDAEWKNHALQLRVSRILLFPAVNLETELVPAVRGGKVEVSARSCRVGWIALPPALVTNELQKQIQMYEETPEFQVIPEIIREMTVHENGIRLRFRPQKINLLIPLLLGMPVNNSNNEAKK